MDTTAFLMAIMPITLIMLIVFLLIGSIYMARALVGEIAATRRLRKMAREYADAEFCTMPTAVDIGARGEMEDDLK